MHITTRCWISELVVVAVAWGVVALAATAVTAQAPPAAVAGEFKVIEVKKIWDGAPHNAFTDLIRHKETWYCVFREGSGHIPGTDGTIRIIRSADGAKWESAGLLAEKTIDLRDPKISVMPDGRLMIVMGGSVYDGQEPKPGRKRTNAHSRVSFSADGTKWTEPKAVEGVGDYQWLWRVTWHKGVGYGAVYSMEADRSKRVLSVWKTSDGIKYEKIADPRPQTDLSEATIRFLPADDTMVILLRTEGKSRTAWVGHAKPPYDQWTWEDGKHPAQGPNFIVLEGAAQADGTPRMIYAGRTFPTGKAVTAVGTMTLKELVPQVQLPSGGDTSYPGLVMAGPTELWVSYYSGHEGKTSIYLARIAVPAGR